MKFSLILGKLVYLLDRCRAEYLLYQNNREIQGEGTVTEHVNLVHPEHIFLGKNSYINGGDVFASPNAKIIIGENCMISYGVHLRTDMHKHNDASIPMKEQGVFEKDIIIGNDVWVGYGAQIMAGVTVADGCIIGAGAVVTHDTEPYGVYGGVPAKRISDRQ